MSPAFQNTDRVVCHCLRVTESQIRDALVTGRARHVYDVMDETRAGSSCHSCKHAIKQVIAAECSQAPSFWKQLNIAAFVTRFFGRLQPEPIPVRPCGHQGC